MQLFLNLIAIEMIGKFFGWYLALVAFAVNLASLRLVLLFWYPHGLTPERYDLHWQWFSGLFLFWLLVQYIFGLFETRTYFRIDKFLRALASSWVAAVIVGALYFYFQPELLITPRRFLLAVVTLSFIFFGALAWSAARFGRRIGTTDVYLLSDSPRDAKLVAGAVTPVETFKGCIDTSKVSGLKYGVVVVLAQSFKMTWESESVVLAGRRRGMQFIRLADFIESRERRIWLEALDNLWLLEHGGSRRKAYDRTKRLLDILVAAFGLVVLAVVYLPAAALIRLTSNGPALFRQKRIGLFGRSFEVIKLRTMMTNAGVSWTEKNDERITFVGKFLRRWRIDELPQFWNILKGEMSLVGPRPEQVHFVEHLKQEVPFFDERHTVKPGLTGWAQLHVYASTFEESQLKLEYDLYYVKHRSLAFDLEILLKTIAAVVLNRGR